MAVSGDFWRELKRGVRHAGREECGGEGVGLELCARRDKMAPAAPSLAAAMMGLGEGVAALRPVLLFPLPEVSASSLRAWGELWRPCGFGFIVSWSGRGVLRLWQRALLQRIVGLRLWGRGVGERSGPPRFWVVQLSLLYCFTSRVLPCSCVYYRLLAPFLWLTFFVKLLCCSCLLRICKWGSVALLPFHVFVAWCKGVCLIAGLNQWDQFKNEHDFFFSEAIYLS